MAPNAAAAAAAAVQGCRCYDLAPLCRRPTAAIVVAPHGQRPLSGRRRTQTSRRTSGWGRLEAENRATFALRIGGRVEWSTISDTSTGRGQLVVIVTTWRHAVVARRQPTLVPRLLNEMHEESGGGGGGGRRLYIYLVVDVATSKGWRDSFRNVVLLNRYEGKRFGWMLIITESYRRLVHGISYMRRLVGSNISTSVLFTFTDIKNIFNHTPSQNILNFIKNQLIW